MSLAMRLNESPAEEPENDASPIPAGNIYSWDGEPALNGTGTFSQWSIQDENIIRTRKMDVMTIRIRIPPPDPVIVDVLPEMETFEWMTAHGKKESIRVDKRTLSMISHPKMFNCSQCNRHFVGVEQTARCPWCSGRAQYVQEL